MPSKLFQKLQATIFGGALIIGTASIISRCIGLVRDNLLAKIFGPSTTLKAYYAAFKVPDLIFNIIVLDALSAAFIPTFLEIWNKKEKTEAWKVVNILITYVS